MGLHDYTTKEVLNKVLLDSSGNAVDAFSHTTQEALNAALDSANSRLNVSLEGGTISGDVTITGDLTVNGSGGAVYDEIIEGSLHIKTAATGGTIADLAYADDLVIENDNAVGISLRTTDDYTGNIMFQSVTNDTVARILADYNSGSEYLAIEVDGSERMRVNSAGNVGIGAAPSTTLHLTNTANDATAPELRLQNTRAGGAGSDGDDAGTISFYAQDAGSNAEAMSTILSEVGLNTTGSTAGKLTFKTMQGNSSTALLTLSGWAGGSHSSTVSSAVFNTSLVGIGTAAPDGAGLHIHSATAGSVTAHANADELVVEGDGATGISILTADDQTGAIMFGCPSDTQAARITNTQSTGVFTVGAAQTNGVLKLEAGAGTTRMVIDDNSRISLSNNDGNTGNTVFGYHALSNAGAVLSDVGADYNTVYGHLAMGTGTTTNAHSNTAIGYQTLEDITSGDYNTAVGRGAGVNITSGSYHTAIGYTALATCTTASANTAVGYASLTSSTTGQWCTAIGKGALNEMTEGNYNIALGENAGGKISTGTQNVMIGFNSGADGTNTTTGTQNVLVGNSCDTSAAGSANQTVIGYNATGVADNSVTLGNDDVTRVNMSSDGAAVMYADGTINTSDRRFKENIEDTDLGLSFINLLRPVKYNFIENKHDGKTKYGIIAQEVIEVLNETGNLDFAGIKDDNEEKLGADYVQFIAPLIKAVQELSAKVEALESK